MLLPLLKCFVLGDRVARWKLTTITFNGLIIVQKDWRDILIYCGHVRDDNLSQLKRAVPFPQVECCIYQEIFLFPF